jgi:hypothetical protein
MTESLSNLIPTVFNYLTNLVSVSLIPVFLNPRSTRSCPKRLGASEIVLAFGGKVG